MKELQFDNNFWTTSFKKLLASTENDKKLRLVNKILRKALGDEGKKLLEKIDPIYTSPIKTTSVETRKISYDNHKLNNYSELTNTHIYETIRVKGPRACQDTKNSENESNKTNIDQEFRTPIKVRTPISQQHYIPMNEKNASIEYINSTLIKHETNYQNVDYSKVCNEEKEVRGSVRSKIALYEKLARRSYENLNNQSVDNNRNNSLENNRNNSVDKLNIINSHKLKRPDYFFDENGRILSPIRKPQARPLANIENKFVINMFNNRQTYTQYARDPNESEVLRNGDKLYSKDNIVNNETPTNTDKFIKKRNRIMRTSILEAFDHLEHLDASQILPELDAMATEWENMDASTYVFDSSHSNYQDEPIYAYPDKTSKQEKCSQYDDFFKLKEEADKQCKIMRQASKAIELIKENEYNLIETQIEAEKILLAAGYKYERLLEEIRHNHYEDPMTFDRVGSMVIGGIQAELEERRDVECFLCIASSENDVFCSKVVEVGPKVQKISFPEEFVFNNLHSSFQIKIDIYSMKLNRRKCSYKINKKVSNLCKNSRKLFYKDLHTYSLIESEMPISSFNLNGTVTLALDDLIIPNNFKVHLTPQSSLTGYVQVNSRLASININRRKQGFLTIGIQTDYGVIWNRRWCVLQGTSLKYWNYPNDEVSMEPIGELNLNRCTKEVEKAKRSVCARTKTLVMEADDYVCFFNCDTIADLHEWRNILNKVYCVLNSWKLLEHQQGTDL